MAKRRLRNAEVTAVLLEKLDAVEESESDTVTSS
jgi:hypothetical protein